MPAHKHAALIMQYAQDAQETDRPWDRWQFKFDVEWEDCIFGLCFSPLHEYRRKPKSETIDINGYKVPKPLQEAPSCVMFPVYYPDFSDPSKYSVRFWRNRPEDLRLLKLRLLHSTVTAAIKHAEALLSFTKVQP